MVGTRISHYQVEGLIGQGGMGVVYKARDTRLDRPVALKFLPTHSLPTEEDKARFGREARAAARLKHRNVATVYAIDDTDDGQAFIAMEYVEGETLAERLERERLPLEEAIDVALQVAAGVEAAHHQGVVHRDIKPANLMLTEDGVVKILDFGLAKTADAKLTKTGTAMGTVAYMSPEQVRGDEVHARTDIWSLGVVLYELVTGACPFQANYDAAVAYAILNEAPKSISTLNPHVPEALSRVVQRALEKDAAARYSNMGAMIADLTRVPELLQSPVRSKPTLPSLVVLPFVNISSDAENEYFADGLTEEIIAGLRGIDAIRVISRTTAMRFKDSDKDLRTIGKELGVRYVLEGSVRKSLSRLRITAQLVDARDDVHLWSERYNGRLDDVFEIQEQVAGSIFQALSLELSPGEQRQLTRRPVEDARAYALYLRARGEYGRQTQSSLERAMRHLKSAISITEDSALLYASLGQTHFLYGSLLLGASVHHEHLQRAEACARKALELEPKSPRAHGLLGIILYDRFETEEGLRHMKRAANIDPDDYDNLTWAVFTFSMCAKDQEAAVWLERLLEADPLNAFTQFVAGEHHLFAGRFDRAEQHFRRAYELDPEGPNSRTAYAQVLAYSGQIEEALRVLELSEDRVSTNLVWDIVGQAMRYALLKDAPRARGFLTEELRNDARTDMLYSWLLAECYSLLGELDEAIQWLRNAIEGGFLNPLFFSEIDPFLEPIRGSHDFEELLTDLATRWSSLSV